MSRWKNEIARRPLIASLLGLVGIVLVGGAAVELPALFHPRYKPGPYDDLLAKLSDRDSASRLGAAVLRERAATQGAAPLNLSEAARGLRSALAGKPLAELVVSDLEQGSTGLIEVQGWVLPASLVALSILAAKSA